MELFTVSLLEGEPHVLGVAGRRAARGRVVEERGIEVARHSNPIGVRGRVQQGAAAGRGIRRVCILVTLDVPCKAIIS